jgi:transposase
MRNEKQTKVIRKLQDMGYRGRMIYVQRRHPEDGAPVRKTDGIIEDHKRGLSKAEIAKKYETSMQYIYHALSHREGLSSNKQKKKNNKLSYEIWKEIVDVYPKFKKIGGYLSVPVRLVGRDGSSHDGYKTTLIVQEFEHGNFNVKEIAERFDTTTTYVYKLKSNWMKKRMK